MLADAGVDGVAEVYTEIAQCPGEGSDAGGGAADVVEVLAVAVGVFEVELVQCGAAAEDEFGAEVLVLGDRADGL